MRNYGKTGPLGGVYTADAVRFTIASESSLVDSPVRIMVEGLSQNQHVKIRVQRASTNPKFILESYGIFQSDSAGIVNLETQAPIDGTYSGADGMGLFWSMQRLESVTSQPREPQRSPLSPLLFKFSAECEGSVIAQTTIERRWISPDVRQMPVRDDGLVGTYFCHVDGRPRPGVVVFGGSEGGLNEFVAAVLASHGYSTLALAYFGVENLPSQLVDIPMEYVESALTWFSKQAGVNEKWIGIHGTSKGGELALLTASMFPRVKAVVCVSSGGVVLHGITSEGVDVLPGSWTYQGQTIPYASKANPHRSGKLSPPTGNTISFRDWYDFHLSDEAAVQAAMIPVENIQGSILFISGQDDAMFDSERISRWSMERLREHKHPYVFKHLVYPNAGHSIYIPYLLASTSGVAGNGKVWLMGGTTSATARACVDSWHEVLDFFAHETQTDTQ